MTDASVARIYALRSWVNSPTPPLSDDVTKKVLGRGGGNWGHTEEVFPPPPPPDPPPLFLISSSVPLPHRVRNHETVCRCHLPMIYLLSFYFCKPDFKPLVKDLNRSIPPRLKLSFCHWRLFQFDLGYKNDIKGAQAWDIRSLGFSWFLHHEVSTCGWLRG